MIASTTFADLERAIGRPITRHLARGRGMRLYVREGAVNVSVPRGLADAEVLSFVRSQIPWLRKHLTKHDTGHSKGAAEFQLALNTSDRVPIFGVSKAIELSTGGAPFVEHEQKLTLLARTGAYPIGHTHPSDDPIDILGEQIVRSWDGGRGSGWGSHAR